MKVADINQLKISALLPSPKGVALALLEACRREDANISQIAKLIQTDPALWQPGPSLPYWTQFPVLV